MKGSTNNPNGRPKGTPNKITAQTREKIAEALDKGLETFADDLRELHPRERLNILAKFAAFVVPRPKPEDDSEPMEVVVPEIIWRQPSEKVEITRRIIQGREDLETSTREREDLE